MDLGKWNDWLAIGANIGVIAGIVFLALEIRANTASNRIALTTQFSTNWVEINGDVATNRELASLVQKAISDQELDSVELVQLDFFIAQRLAQAAMMRRLYEEGFATRDDVRRSYNSLRKYREYKIFRQAYERRMNDRNMKMVFEEDGVE